MTSLTKLKKSIYITDTVSRCTYGGLLKGFYLNVLTCTGICDQKQQNSNQYLIAGNIDSVTVSDQNTKRLEFFNNFSNTLEYNIDYKIENFATSVLIIGFKHDISRNKIK